MNKLEINNPFAFTEGPEEFYVWLWSIGEHAENWEHQAAKFDIFKFNSEHCQMFHELMDEYVNADFERMQKQDPLLKLFVLPG